MTADNKTEYQPQLFTGDRAQLIDRITYNGSIYLSQTHKAADKAWQTLKMNPPFGDIARFSYNTGKCLYDQGFMSSSAEAFQVSAEHQIVTDPLRDSALTYTKAFLNAIAGHVFALRGQPSEIVIPNMNWFDSKRPVHDYMVRFVEKFKDLEGLAVAKDTFLVLYELSRLHLIHSTN